MPIPGKGSSQKAFRKNVRFFRKREGRPIKQAVAIAFSVARRAARRASNIPGWLRRAARRRRTRHSRLR